MARRAEYEDQDPRTEARYDMPELDDNKRYIIRGTGKFWAMPEGSEHAAWGGEATHIIKQGYATFLCEDRIAGEI
jgi:hypothetical protein